MNDRLLNTIGRPSLTEEEKDVIVQKLEPYLKAGLSLRKACSEANIPKSTVYDLKEKDKYFSDKLAVFQQYLSVLVSNISYQIITRIHAKVDKGENLTKHELDYLKWFALNSKITQEEFGKRMEIEIPDPEERIRQINKLLDERVGKRVLNDPPVTNQN